jgi:ABC-type Mn/Zn transport systems, ATPase component
VAVLEVRELTVQLGNETILDRVSLSVERGEIVATIGPNGAGKTTLLRAVLGLIPYRGSVLLFGKPLSALGPDRARIGYVPQRHDLDRAIPVTVEEYVGINTPGKYFSRESLVQAMREVNAERLLPRRIGQLSGGELQRVMLALNLLHNPELLFLDEPATGIDREGEQLFYDVLEHLRRERSMAVLMVSHDFSVVYRYASRVFCINRELICQGAPGDILNDETLKNLYGHAAAVYEHHD